MVLFCVVNGGDRQNQSEQSAWYTSIIELPWQQPAWQHVFFPSWQILCGKENLLEALPHPSVLDSSSPPWFLCHLQLPPLPFFLKCPKLVKTFVDVQRGDWRRWGENYCRWPCSWYWQRAPLWLWWSRSFWSCRWTLSWTRTGSFWSCRWALFWTRSLWSCCWALSWTRSFGSCPRALLWSWSFWSCRRALLWSQSFWPCQWALSWTRSFWSCRRALLWSWCCWSFDLGGEPQRFSGDLRVPNSKGGVLRSPFWYRLWYRFSCMPWKDQEVLSVHLVDFIHPMALTQKINLTAQCRARSLLWTMRRTVWWRLRLNMLWRNRINNQFKTFITFIILINFINPTTHIRKG